MALSYLEDPLGLWDGAARDEAPEGDVGARLREHHRLRNPDLGLARKVLHRNLGTRMSFICAVLGTLKSRYLYLILF